MAMAYSGVAVFVSLVALFLAMIAIRTATDIKVRNEAEKAKENEKSGTVFQKTDADRRQEAIVRREHENFMNYDGTPQLPIDQDRILGE